MLSKKTKIFLALLIVVIGGGLAYWKWSEMQVPVIEIRSLNKTEVSFRMSYKGISYTETVKLGTIWTRTNRGYYFTVIFEHGDMHLSILDKDKSILANKSTRGVI